VRGEEEEEEETRVAITCVFSVKKENG